MVEFVDLFPTNLSTPTLQFLLAKELCLALQQTLHHLRFTYFHRQRHLRGRIKSGRTHLWILYINVRSK